TRPLGQGEACRGAGLHGVGLLAAEEGGAVVLVALGIAARQGEGERGGRSRSRGVGGACGRTAEAVHEVEQGLRIRPGGMEADDEVTGAVLLVDAFEALPEGGIAGGRLGKRQLGSSGLKILLEEGGVMAVARGVDADAEAARRLRSGSAVW